MQQVTLVLVGVCLCAFSNIIVLVSATELESDPQNERSSPAYGPLEPVVLRFDLFKEGAYVQSCYGAHIDVRELNRINWIMPAKCVDETKFDMIAVRSGYKEIVDAKFNFKNLKIYIHPNNNIAIVILPHWPYMDPRTGFRHIQLPSLHEDFDDKTLNVYEYKNITTNIENQDNMFLFKVKTKLINKAWCQLVYSLLSLKEDYICGAGWPGNALIKELGVPLIFQDGDIFKLVGLSTTSRSWTYDSFPLPIQFLNIQAYLDWIIHTGRLN